MSNLRSVCVLATLLAGAFGCAPASPAATNSSEQLVNPITIRSEGIQPKQVKRVGLRVPDGLVGQAATVFSDVQVSAAGDVVGTLLVEGDPALHRSLSEAVRGWKFEPLIVGGEARAFVLPLRVDLSWASGSANIRMSIRNAE